MSSASLIQGLRQARVLVLHPRDRDGDELLRQLKRIGCQVDLAWPAPPNIPDGIDVVYFLLDPDQAAAMNWRGGELRATMIAIIDFENPTILKELLDSNAHGVLVRPIRPGGVLSTLVAGRLIATVGYVPVFTGLGFLHLTAFAVLAWAQRPVRAS